MSDIFILSAGGGLVTGFIVGFIAYFLGFTVSKSLHLFEL